MIKTKTKRKRENIKRLKTKKIENRNAKTAKLVTERKC